MVMLSVTCTTWTCHQKTHVTQMTVSRCADYSYTEYVRHSGRFADLAEGLRQTAGPDGFRALF
eukprot:836354-Amphidinium_carterae.2